MKREEKIAETYFKSLGFTNIEFEPKRNRTPDFVIENEIKYIGKSVKTISQRPNISQRTNFRLNNLIIEKLEKGEEVEIYLFEDNAELSYKGKKINLSAGLEDNLIAEHFTWMEYFGKKQKINQQKNSYKIENKGKRYGKKIYWKYYNNNRRSIL